MTELELLEKSWRERWLHAVDLAEYLLEEREELKSEVESLKTALRKAHNHLWRFHTNPNPDILPRHRKIAGQIVEDDSHLWLPATKE